MKIEADCNNHYALLKFDNGASIEFMLWDRNGDGGHLKVGETDFKEDGCTFTRLEDFEVRYDPGLLPVRRKRRGGRRAA